MGIILSEKRKKYQLYLSFVNLQGKVVKPDTSYL